MKKSAKKILSIVLVICILSTGLGAFAATNQTMQPYSVMYTHIDALGAGLSMGALGYATCISSLEITNSTDTGTLYMFLQRYVSGSWTNITSWSVSGTPNLNQTGHYYVTSGYSYRVHAIAYIYTNGTLVETATQDSSSVYY